MNNSFSDALKEISHNTEHEVKESQLTLEALVIIIIFIIYTISSSLFSKYNFHYLFGSGICMIIGVSFTLVSMIVNPEVN